MVLTNQWGWLKAIPLMERGKNMNISLEQCNWCKGTGMEDNHYPCFGGCEGTGFKYGKTAEKEWERQIEEAEENNTN